MKDEKGSSILVRRENSPLTVETGGSKRSSHPALQQDGVKGIELDLMQNSTQQNSSSSTTATSQNSTSTGQAGKFPFQFKIFHVTGVTATADPVPHGDTTDAGRSGALLHGGCRT